MLKSLCKVGLFLVAVIAITPRAHACNEPPGFGFTIAPVIEDLSGPVIAFDKIPGEEIVGIFENGDSTTKGDQSGFAGFTNNKGQLAEKGKASPANWLLEFSTNPGTCTDNGKVVHLAASSTAQQVVCATINPDSLSASPSSVTSGVQNTVTMTDTSEAWPRTPYYVYEYDPGGNIASTNYATVTDSYDCYTQYYPVVDPSVYGFEYLWLTDSNGMGMGYVTVNLSQ